MNLITFCLFASLAVFHVSAASTRRFFDLGYGLGAGQGETSKGAVAGNQEVGDASKSFIAAILDLCASNPCRDGLKCEMVGKAYRCNPEKPDNETVVTDEGQNTTMHRPRPSDAKISNDTAKESSKKDSSEDDDCFYDDDEETQDKESGNHTDDLCASNPCLGGLTCVLKGEAYLCLTEDEKLGNDTGTSLLSFAEAAKDFLRDPSPARPGNESSEDGGDEEDGNQKKHKKKGKKDKSGTHGNGTETQGNGTASSIYDWGKDGEPKSNGTDGNPCDPNPCSDGVECKVDGENYTCVAGADSEEEKEMPEQEATAGTGDGAENPDQATTGKLKGKGKKNKKKGKKHKSGDGSEVETD